MTPQIKHKLKHSVDFFLKFTPLQPLCKITPAFIRENTVLDMTINTVDGRYWHTAHLYVGHYGLCTDGSHVGKI